MAARDIAVPGAVLLAWFVFVQHCMTKAAKLMAAEQRGAWWEYWLMNRWHRVRSPAGRRYVRLVVLLLPAAIVLAWLSWRVLDWSTT